MAIVKIDGIPVYDATLGEDGGMLRISLVDAPAVMADFVAFAKQKPVQMYRIEDEEQRMVLGVVMRADFPIYRRDERFGEYYIIYRADTIREMAQKYLAEGRQNNVNLMHQGEDVEGVEMVQYFLKGKGLQPDGFEDIADGSLFAEFHIVDDAIWNKVKDGTYKGFSLEGLFDLVPEEDKDDVQRIVDDLDGKFNETQKPNKKMKVKKFLKALGEALLKMGTITTDKGVLAWDGEEDLKEGDRVWIEDEEGNRSDVEDGQYKTTDGKVINVVDNVVASIEDAEAEVAPEEQPETFGSVNTDKGEIRWDGEGELEAGVEVYVVNEDGERAVPEDGDYTTEDGKVIRVEDGKVAEIRDPEAEVAPQDEFKARIQKMEASYDEIFANIAAAVREALGNDDIYVVEAGADYAVVAVWDENGEKFLRYALETAEDGTVTLKGEPVEVKPMFVPMDFVSPFEKGAEEEAPAAEEEELRKENETLREQLTAMRKKAAARPAHEEFQSIVRVEKTGNKGMDRIAKLMAK